MIPFFLAAAMLASGLGGGPPAARPRLVILIAVDQLRGDYLARYQAQWTGGFRRLLAQGAVFTDGRQDHAITETAPGHSTLLSGRSPASTGIVTNSAGVGDPASPLIGAPGDDDTLWHFHGGSGSGASPWRFRGTTLYDWLRSADSTTRVLSVSYKDRGAILPVGRADGQVYWWADGGFTTSRYYRDTLPDWVQAWNDRPGVRRLEGTTWNLLLPASRYGEPDSMPYEHGGANFTFPHRLPADSTLLRSIVAYPWMDSLTLDVALEGARRLHLGAGEKPDLLVISLSATDAIGHAYGPDSREIHDQLLRLDHWLGWFLDSLATMVPPGETVLALSADHGVQAFPEWALSAGAARMGTTGMVGYTDRAGPGGAGRVWLGGLARALDRTYRQRYNADFHFEFHEGLITADVAALRARGVNTDSLARELAAAAAARAGVARVFTPRTLAAAPDSDHLAHLWREALPPDLQWLICAGPRPGWTWQSGGGWATHGSTNPADTHVPIILWGAGVRPGVYGEPARTVDIGPTLARLAGVAPTEPVEGRVLQEAVANGGVGGKR